MLFNSYGFILFFLPVVLAVYFALGQRCHQRIVLAWLVVSSLFFYGWWNPVYLLLLLPSILINYLLGREIGTEGRYAKRKYLLVLGVSFNLLLIGYFKYANFFVDSANELLATGWNLQTIVLPLAISFYTFQQVAYLIDAYKSRTHEKSLLNYSLFVTFFPQLIAGPIVHHAEMLPQFASRNVFRINHKRFAMGITIFLIGLFKKVVLADSVAIFATPVFAAADSGVQVTIFEAWGGVLAYTFQLYFDFSGYSDMAIGIALLFGIFLPINFDSPYKAVNIIDFWRRWHITLSRFLRDYLYFGLGGNRKGKSRRYANLMITMVLGGLWHGAGWTFVIWGVLHGSYLIVNHAWHGLRNIVGLDPSESTFGTNLVARAITFIAVVFSWAIFRSESLDGAVAMLSGMIGMNGSALDVRLSTHLSFLSDFVTFQGKHAGSFSLWGVPWIVGLAAVAMLLPNVQQIIGYTGVNQSGILDEATQSESHRSLIAWSPNFAWALIVLCMTFCSLHCMSRLSEFLYFQF